MASLDLNQGEWHVVHDRNDFCRNFDIGMNTTHLPCVRTRGVFDTLPCAIYRR
jgi:hypothetical protein